MNSEARESGYNPEKENVLQVGINKLKEMFEGAKELINGPAIDVKYERSVDKKGFTLTAKIDGKLVQYVSDEPYEFSFEPGWLIKKLRGLKDDDLLVVEGHAETMNITGENTLSFMIDRKEEISAAMVVNEQTGKPKQGVISRYGSIHPIDMPEDMAKQFLAKSKELARKYGRQLNLRKYEKRYQNELEKEHLDFSSLN